MCIELIKYETDCSTYLFGTETGLKYKKISIQTRLRSPQMTLLSQSQLIKL